MKKITSKKFSKRLTQYGALTVAIGGIAEVNGQVIYTDIDPDVGGPIFSYELNLDNDGAGNHDFTIEDWDDRAGSGSAAFKIWVKAGNAVAGVAPSYVYPFALSSGAVIDVNQPWQSNSGNSQWQTLKWLDSSGVGCYYSSQWCTVTDKYLGLRFEIAGETHYGWARLNSPEQNNTGNWTIKDYAYESKADTPITVGAGINMGVADNELASRVKIVSVDNSIKLLNLPEETNYKLYSIMGQKILIGETRHQTHVIEVGKLSSGIYVVEIEDGITNGVFRKKIVMK